MKTIKSIMKTNTVCARAFPSLSPTAVGWKRNNQDYGGLRELNWTEGERKGVRKEVAKNDILPFLSSFWYTTVRQNNYTRNAIFNTKSKYMFLLNSTLYCGVFGKIFLAFRGNVQRKKKKPGRNSFPSNYIDISLENNWFRITFSSQMVESLNLDGYKSKIRGLKLKKLTHAE